MFVNSRTTPEATLGQVWNWKGQLRVCCIHVLAVFLILHISESTCHKLGLQGILQNSNLHPTLRNKDYEGYEIVLPYQANLHGHFISHDLTPIREGPRRRRDTNTNAKTHYKFTGYGQEFHLEVISNDKLLAPAFSIHHRKDGQSRTEHPDATLDNCHYQGTLRSDAHSKVAVSLCHGLTGFVQTEADQYLIEPLSAQLAGHHNISLAQEQRPHILYKRFSLEKSVLKNVSKPRHFCGLEGKFDTRPLEEEDSSLTDDSLVTEPAIKLRRKRTIEGNIHRNRHVETLVVVDKKMIKNHGEEKITSYVLTVLNMVSSLYKDASLGNTINIVLVSLLLLYDDQPGLNIDHHADHSLNSFCQWQSTLTTPNGTQHDHAILLTGMDICSWKNEPCDTLGFAPIGGMCSKYRSCTINEDTGLGLAFTVAHESGHSFGMVHDGVGNNCKKSSGNIMSPTLSGNNGRFIWSVCSQDYIADFLSSSRASCTEDEPVGITSYQFPLKLPGELYNADKQCQWQFGRGARLCSFNFGKSLCQSMWCHRGVRRCETKFLPAADGTPCGDEQWCIQGECVNHDKKNPIPTHGGWSEYGEFGSCSRTCGGGVQHTERQCDSPSPKNGGRYCEGASRVYRMCSTQKCDVKAASFRAVQCASYNSSPFRGLHYQWKPYIHTERKEACKLYCMADGYDFYFPLSSKAFDGTECSHNSLDVCVDGICQEVGCDYILGSNASLDACGNCQGDNSTCEFIEGVYMEQHTANNEYYQIVKIPATSRNIIISELAPSTSYLALRSEDYDYYLTGSWIVDWPGNFQIAGALFEYRRPFNKPEYLQAVGPTDKALVLEVLLQGINPGIEYRFSVNYDLANLTLNNIYEWQLVVSDCSATCAKGVKTREVFCLENNTTKVKDLYCDNTTRPSTAETSCNLMRCPARWVTSKWSECTRSCNTGQQKRRVKCTRTVKDGIDKNIKELFCSGPKPRKRKKCNKHSCPPQWVTSDWSECSVSCDSGFMTRTVTCGSIKSNGQQRTKPESMCSGSIQPKILQTCETQLCPKNVLWHVTSWTQCSVTCGKGHRTRSLQCRFEDNRNPRTDLPDSECSHIDKPSSTTTRPCFRGMCKSQRGHRAAVWRAGTWSQCSKSCGGGVQRRSVECLTSSATNGVAGCNDRSKPMTSQSCNTETCLSDCFDQYNWCYLVPQHKMCNHNFYGPKCCNTCKGNV